MMSKPIQSVDATNTLLSTPQAATQTDSGAHDAALFSSFFPTQPAELPASPHGQSSPAGGNILPLPALPTEAQPRGMDGAMLVNELAATTGDPHSAAAPAITVSREVPGRPTLPAPDQQVRAQDIAPASQPLADNNPAVADAVKLAITPAGEMIPAANPAAAQVAEKLLPAEVHTSVQQIQMAARAPEQADHMIPLMTGTHLPSPVQLTEASTQLSSSLAPPQAQLSSQAVQLQAQLNQANTQPVRPEGAPAELHTVIRHAGIEAEPNAVAGTVLAPVRSVPAADTDRASTGREPVATVARQAIQSMLASQAGDGELKQFLQNQHNSHSGAEAMPALTRADTNLLSFMQSMSESGPMTLPSAKVQVPVGQQGWDKAVGQQLALFVSQDVSAAKLRLNPQHLGPMEMQINVDGDKANVSFLSQHTVVREALESSVPRLREMLAESGLNLVNVNISQQGTSGQNGRGMSGFQQGMDFPGRVQAPMRWMRMKMYRIYGSNGWIDR